MRGFHKKYIKNKKSHYSARTGFGGVIELAKLYIKNAEMRLEERGK